MRQGQPQSRHRSRPRSNNRNTNNRNHLNRSIESNGPDVKIRGTATHIAEKYMQLARDAESGGDNVAAESYWQHAEHYNRLIVIAQAQAAQQQIQRVQHISEENDADCEQSLQTNEVNNNNMRSRGRGRRQRQFENIEKTINIENISNNDPFDGTDSHSEMIVKEEPSFTETVDPESGRTPSRRSHKKAESAVLSKETSVEHPLFLSGVEDE
ncbi:DUF4167 domain-containing protein [Candidatus Endowatersipora endosymbiont of Watersipora subatra]|uniref:DUF4167 domain-containing protein n=1 Tax=Candidatus Endowatersipora endosymbiont of Watersipora subatra TaxID=3077946 RepID=UPI00312CA630